MELEEIKRLNLLLLIAQRGGRSAIADVLGYADTNYLNQLAIGSSKIGAGTAKKIRAGFGLSSTWLTTEHPEEWLRRLPDAEISGLSINVENVGSTRELRGDIPEISWVMATDWDEACDPYAPGVAVDWHMTSRPHSPSTYALKVRGYSMVNPLGVRPTYFAGDIIIVDPEQAGGCSTGDRVIALLEDDSLPHERRVTFKQLIIDGADTFLRPLNPGPGFRVIREPFRIIGKVINVIGE